VAHTWAYNWDFSFLGGVGQEGGSTRPDQEMLARPYLYQQASHGGTCLCPSYAEGCK
jgi:hypothetical protein